MKVSALELLSGYRAQQQAIDSAVMSVLSSGYYIGGPVLESFERQFAAYCNAKFCVGVANGLDALHLALRGLGIGPGDEIITASNSYIATLLAISAVGARPVLVEPDAGTFALDPEKVLPAVTDRTRAILPTHLFGHPADLGPLRTICDRYSLFLVEDAAQAHGARYKGERVGSHGDAVCWSFYPTKNLGAYGDGGAVTTNNEELAASIRMLGNYGQSSRYHNDVRGTNSRLDPLQAAVLAVKLERLDEANGGRRRIAERYSAALANSRLTLPVEREWATSVWHQFVVRHADRDAFQAALLERGVQTLIHYPIPPHLQPAYRDLNLEVGKFPIAEKIAATCLSLPIWAEMTDETVEAVISAVLEADRAVAQ